MQVKITDATGYQLRLEYDASNACPFTVNSAGDLTIVPTGGDTNITGRLTVASEGRFGAGTAAAPGVRVGTVETGLFQDTNTLGFSQNGTRRGSIISGVWILGSGAAAGDAAAGGIRAVARSQFDAGSASGSATAAAGDAVTIQAPNNTYLMQILNAAGASVFNCYHLSDVMQFDGAVDVVNGLLKTFASATGGAGFRIPHGTAPTSPVNGDMWSTSAGGLFIQINGVTKTVTLT